jgi:hypothetical protein
LSIIFSFVGWDFQEVIDQFTYQIIASGLISYLLKFP